MLKLFASNVKTIFFFFNFELKVEIQSALNLLYIFQKKKICFFLNKGWHRNPLKPLGFLGVLKSENLIFHFKSFSFNIVCYMAGKRNLTLDLVILKSLQPDGVEHLYFQLYNFQSLIYQRFTKFTKILGLKKLIFG